MSSLRGRLTAGLLVGMGFLLAAGGLLLNQVLGARLRRDFDAGLVVRARSLESLTEQEAGEVWLELVDQMMPGFEPGERPDYFELWRGDGAVVARSPSLGRRDLPRSGAPAGRPRLGDLTLPDGRPGRAVEIRFHPRLEEEDEKWRGIGEPPALVSRAPAGGAAAVLVVARGREDLDAFLAAVRTALALAALGLLGGTAVLVKVVLGIGLAPLDQLGRRLEAMDAGTLGEALEGPGAPAELVPMIRRLDALLARLRESFERERSFSANLAHELRTPLAELRALAEVVLKWPGDSASLLGSFAEVREIGLQMERVVVNLLALARCDGGQQTVWVSEVPLGEVAASCWSGVAAEAGERGMAFAPEIPEELTVSTDREKLALILSNLFANAVAYGAPGGTVTCSAAAEGEGFALRVSNPTDGLTVDDLPRIFDRFWRKDPARTGGQHAGLGLALVSSLCELLRFEKRAHLLGGRFEITLLGPLVPEL